MLRAEVAPSFFIDEEMYGAAHVAVNLYAPRAVESFTWEWFTTRENWALIPDVEHPDLPFYKAECQVVHGDPYHQTLKINVWVAPDLRRDNKPYPHSHPWSFTGHVLLGGYTEDRYEVDASNLLLLDPCQRWQLGSPDVTRGVEHKAGTANHIPRTLFHEVTAVHEPGRTLSVMNCSEGVKEGWGYYDPDSGLYLPNKQSPIDKDFLKLLNDRNPHRRK